MKGFKSITEMAKEIGIERGTLKQKIQRAPIKHDKMGKDETGRWMRYYGPTRQEKIKKLCEKKV